MGSTFGNIFKVTTWGESHGKAIGAVVDGCPSGILLNETDIQTLLDRRKPGNSKYATERKEDDVVSILSGVFENKTTGTPISLILYNKDSRSSDYSEIANYYRPGHADYTFDEKYGFRDYRGSGRASGRETAARVAAGAIAKKILSELNIKVTAYTHSIHDIEINKNNFDENEIFNNKLFMPDKQASEKAMSLLDKSMQEHDSVGGVVECSVTGLFAGIGEPVFDKLDACLAKAIMSIGAVKSFEVGLGHNATKIFGSENNDEYFYDEQKVLNKKSNNAGGILGGISDGFDMVCRAHIKPTSSIFKTQSTVNKNKENIKINIQGRHDPTIVPRAVVVVESMVAITLVDLLFCSMTSRMDNIKRFFSGKQ